MNGSTLTLGFAATLAAASLAKRGSRAVEADDFNLCFPRSVKRLRELQQADLGAKVVQVSGYVGKVKPGTDPRWLAIPPAYWSHYVVVSRGTVHDLTPRQFGAKVDRLEVPLSTFMRDWSAAHDVPEQAVARYERELAKKGRRKGSRNTVPASVIAEAKQDARLFAHEIQRWMEEDDQEEFTNPLYLYDAEIGDLFGDRVLGIGGNRVALASSDLRFVIKLTVQETDNLNEARAWLDAGPETKKMLVPVVAFDPDGRWLIMERAEPLLPSSQRVSGWLSKSDKTPLADLLARAQKVGLLDVHDLNVTSDFRLLDYGEPTSLKGSPAKHDSTSSRPFSQMKKGIHEVKVGKAVVLWSLYEDRMDLSSIRVPKSARRQGHASRAVQAFVEEADLRGLPATLCASPLDKSTSLKRLIKLYSRFGFRLTGLNCNLSGHPWMRREPERSGSFGRPPRGSAVRAARKPKPPTLTDLGLPTVWFHGTRAAFTGRLKPNKGMGGACVWLADREGAKEYARQGPASRLIEVTLETKTRVADLSNADDPVVREFIRRDRSASNVFWHGREGVTDEEMRDAVAAWERRTTHYDAVEARGWAKAYFREAGVDALLVRDVRGWGGHESMLSLCVLNRAKILKERQQAAS